MALDGPTRPRAQWTDEAAHSASLQAPGVGELIARARPLLAGMSGRTVLTVLGGKGLPTA